MFGSTRFMFLRKADATPSAGSAIDHIGFSVANLDATLKTLTEAGVKVTSPRRDVEKLFPLAFVEDPWGTRIEVVEDRELPGLHHVHMRGPDPEEVFTWLLDKFGGERTKLKGQIDAVKYSADGFSTVWILVTRGEAQPSLGHAIDHIGWRSNGLNDTVAELKGKGVTVTAEPRPLTLPNGPPINFWTSPGRPARASSWSNAPGSSRGSSARTAQRHKPSPAAPCRSRGRS